MHIFDDNKPFDIQSAAENFTNKGSTQAEHHDFFTPKSDNTSNAKTVIPKFDCDVFVMTQNLPKEDYDEDYKTDLEKYRNLMNQSAEGKIQVLEKQIYHSKDGDVTIYLEWLSLPKEFQIGNNAPENPLPDLPLHEVPDSILKAAHEEKKAKQESKKDENGKKKRHRNRKKDNDIPDEPTVLM